MDKLGIVYHPKYEAARRLADDAAQRLSGRVGDVWVASAWDDDARAAHLDATELLICCGGDGTMLKAARAVVPHKVVLLGVNMGRIGFLTELGPTALCDTPRGRPAPHGVTRTSGNRGHARRAPRSRCTHR